MIRWLRGETVGDLCRESAHISCVMVAEGILSPFSAHFYPVRTSWCEYHVELSAAYLFLTSDLHFLYAQSVILGQGVDLFVVSGR